MLKKEVKIMEKMIMKRKKQKASQMAMKVKKVICLQMYMTLYTYSLNVSDVKEHLCAV